MVQPTSSFIKTIAQQTKMSSSSKPIQQTFEWYDNNLVEVFLFFFYVHYLSRLLLLSFAIKNNAETLLLVGPRPRLMDHKDDVATAEWGDHWIAWQKMEEKLFRVLGSLSLLKDLPRSTCCYITVDLSIFYGRQIDH